jgi:NAD(P)-dependent dehydrogenase (short-subunit alcohol dehydrogenase family)
MELATLTKQNCARDGRIKGNCRATAAALAEAGAHVLVHYGRSSKEAETLVRQHPCQRRTGGAIRADPGNYGWRNIAGKRGSLDRPASDWMCPCVQRWGQQDVRRSEIITIEDFRQSLRDERAEPVLSDITATPAQSSDKAQNIVSDLSSHRGSNRRWAKPGS